MLIDHCVFQPRLGGNSAHNATSMSPVWPPNRGPNYDVTQPRLKFSHAKAGGRTKKQALSCYFCRERKIACGRPDESNNDQTCNQCARRKIECRYPTKSFSEQLHDRRDGSSQHIQIFNTTVITASIVVRSFPSSAPAGLEAAFRGSWLRGVADVFLIIRAGTQGGWDGYPCS
ncbi:hypothetical protein C8F04DRAFT_657995 [Mycena alexandri]|uniref:Zn(2)-C6 fungal-type domain-containing protein n=1 Tax=Mycena alexandri TaxID=1745969 RepID=A0AAD6SQT3_9AGAR|nr:hypothetical protein C8F04DRAFT_657995 [Mycena alexandri]